MKKDMPTNYTEEERQIVLKDLDKNLKELFEQYKINTAQAVDVFALASKMGFSVHFYNGPKFPYTGAIIVNENETKLGTFSKNKVIILSSKLSLKEAIFTLAHEIAHYLVYKWVKKDEAAVFEFRDEHRPAGRSESENFIDFIAASILVPKDGFIKIAEALNITSENYKETADSKEESLARFYDVDTELIHRRFKEVFDENLN